MSNVIDERVVSMQFDNKHFETNVKTSLSTLDKLKQSLNLSGSAKGLENISQTAKKFDLSPIGYAVDKVGLKFSALYTIADQSLRNIVNSAERAAKNIVSAFTITPVKTGFKEYETQINAVQTILANTQSKGSTLDDVNRALDELNTYADKTIYNFTEMTRNIGTFTAAGVELDKSVSAIKGIANLAAVSGSTSQQASTAMYQLSQALAAGKVQLMDWNSVVNAGMGGQLFQDALKRTATQMGYNVDAMIKKYGSFRESLTKGEWLTAEVLTETLTQLSGAYSEADLIAKGYTESQAKEIYELSQTAVDAATKVKTFTQLMDTLTEAAQSGWTQSWELLVGDFEQAKEMYTGWSDLFGEIIGKSAESRNRLLEGALVSKWDRLTKKINEAGVSTADFEEAVKNAAKANSVDIDTLLENHGSIENIFKSEAASSKILKEAILSLNKTITTDLSIDRKLGFGDTGEDVKEAQKALKQLGYDLGDFGEDGIDGIVGKYTTAAIKAFQEANGLVVDGILNDETRKTLEKALAHQGKLIQNYGDLLSGLDQADGRELIFESLRNAVDGVIKAVSVFKEAWRDIFPPMTSEKLYNIIEAIHAFSEKLIMGSETSDKLKRTLKGLFSIIDIIRTVTGGALNAAFRILCRLLKAADIDILSVTASIGDAISGFRDWILENDKLTAVFDKVVSVLINAGSAIRDWIKWFWELPVVQENVARFGEAFKATFSNLKTWFGGLYDKIKAFFSIFKDGYITGANGEKIALSITSVFEYFKENVLGYFSNFKNIDIFANIREALKNFKSTAETYLESIGLSFDGIKDKIVNFMSSIKKAIGDNAGTLASVAILLSFFFILVKIKNAVVSLTGALKGMSIKGFLDSIAESFAKKVKSESIKNIATSITMLAGAVAVLAMLPIKNVWSAVGAITALSIVLVVITKLLGKVDNIKDLGKVSGVIFSFASSMLILAVAAKMISSMDWATMGKAGVVISALLLTVLAISAIAKKSDGKLDGFSKTMLQFSGGLAILAIAIRMLGGMDTKVLIQGGIAVGVFLVMMAGMMAATKHLSKDLPRFGSTILSLSASLIILGVAVRMLGGMDTKVLIKGGIAVGVFLGMIAGMMVATKRFSKDIPKFGTMMLGLSAGLLSMALAVKIFGSMDAKTIAKGEIAIAALLGMLAGLMAATKLLGRNSSNAGKVGLMMLSFSASIFVLSAAIAALSFIKPADLAKSVAAISAIGIMMTVVMTAASRLGKDTKGSIIALSASIGMLALSLGALSFVDPVKLAAATGAISAVLGAFALLLLSTKSLTGATGKSISTIIVMTGVITLLAGAIYLLATLPTKNVLSVALSLSAIIASLSASCLMLSKVGTFGKSAFIGIGVLTALLAVLGAAVAIGIASLPAIGSKLSEFMINLKPFMDGITEIDSSIFNGIKTLSEAMFEFSKAGFVFAVGNVFSKGGMTAAFTSFANWIRQVFPIIKEFALELSAEGVDINTENLSAVIGAVKDLAIAANSAPSTKAAGGIIKIGKSIAAGGYISIPYLSEFGQWIKDVVPIVKNFALDMSANGLTINSAAITAVMDAVKSLGEAANLAPGVKVAAGFAKIGPAILGGAYISVPNLKAFGEWIKAILPELKGFAMALSNADLKDTDYTGVKTIFEAVTSLAEAAAAAPKTEGGGGLAITGFGVIAGGYASVPDLTGFAQWIKDIKQPIIDLASTVKGLELNPDDYTGIKAICESVKILGEATGSVPPETTVEVLFGVYKSITKTDLAGFAQWIIDVKQPMIDLAVAVDGLDLTPEDYTGIKTICEGVKALGEAAGSVPPNTMATVATILGGGVYVKSTDLDAFTSWIEAVTPKMINLAGTVKGLNLNSEDYAGVKDICEGVKILAEAANLAPKTEGGGGLAVIGPAIAAGGYLSVPNLGAFTSWIVSVTPKMTSLASAVAGLNLNDSDFTAIKTICESVKILAEAADAAPKTEEAALLSVIGPAIVSGAYVKSTDLAAFATFITDIQDPLVTLAKKLTGESFDDANFDNVTTMCTAAKTIAEAAQNVPIKTEMSTDTWSLLGTNSNKLVSGADLNGFVTWVSGVLDALSAFQSKISGNSTIDTATISLISSAISSLVSLANAVPEDKSGIYKYFSNNEINWSAFGTNLGLFADAMASFSTKISGKLDLNAIAVASEAGRKLAEMLRIITYDFANSELYGMFYAEIEKFANAVVKFSDIVSGINVSAVTAAATTGSKIAKILLDLSNFDYASVNVNSLSNKMEELATAIKEFSINIAGVDVTDAVSETRKLMSLMSGMSEISFEGASSFQTALRDLSKTGIEDFVEAFSDAEEHVIKAANSLVDSAVNAINAEGNYSRFAGAGKYVASGFANGIGQNTFKAEAKARAMAKRALIAAKKVLDINSPSREFRKMGRFAPEGFALGIDDMSHIVEDSSMSMAATALNATKNAISRIVDVIDSDIDAQPTIRPIMDLSDISYGINEMDNMFSLRQPVGVMANVRSINSMMNDRNQNGSNSDVISAIEGLGRKLGNTPNNTYSINGITYDDGSNVSEAVKDLIRAVRIERRV